ncbi:oligosaccharide flippase family protein [Akkermansiaceae bacterium]|nr:oligosaccharide flippase family protein [Akkermansiaceae bacterium]
MFSKFSKWIRSGEGAFRATGFFLFSKFLTKGISFLLIPVWTAAFSPTDYGIIGTLVAWIGIASPLLVMGLPSAVVRLKSDCPTDEEWNSFVGSVAIVVFLTAVSFLGLGLVFGQFVWGNLPTGNVPYWPFVPIAVVGLTMGALGKLGISVQNAQQNPGRAVFYEQVLSFGTVLSALLFVFVFDQGLKGYLIGGVVASIGCSFIFCRDLLRKCKKFKFDNRRVKEALRFGVPMIPMALAAWALSFSDRIMLNDLVGLKESGFYSLAANIALIVSMVAVSLNQGIVPRYLKIILEFGSGSASRIKVRGLTVPAFGFLTAVTLAAMSLGGPLLINVVNSRYEDAIPLLIPVIGGCYFFGVWQLTILPLISEKRTKTIALTTIVGASVNVMLNYYLIPRYGAIAAAYTTLISYFILAVLTQIIVLKKKLLGISVIETLALSLLVIACVYLCSSIQVFDFRGVILRGAYTLDINGSIAGLVLDVLEEV